MTVLARSCSRKASLKPARMRFLRSLSFGACCLRKLSAKCRRVEKLSAPLRTRSAATHFNTAVPGVGLRVIGGCHLAKIVGTGGVEKTTMLSCRPSWVPFTASTQSPPRATIYAAMSRWQPIAIKRDDGLPAAPDNAITSEWPQSRWTSLPLPLAPAPAQPPSPRHAPGAAARAHAAGHANLAPSCHQSRSPFRVTEKWHRI